MISETFFSSHFPSVWRGIAPTMEEFVRTNNVRGYERVWSPLESKIDSGRRGLVNEAAFVLLTREIKGATRATHWADDVLGATQTAHRYITGDRELKHFVAPSSLESSEVREIHRRLRSFFGGANAPRFRPTPPFPGCGIIASCFGDIEEDSGSLYELKNGDRPFRSIDYRQLSVYLALRYAATRVLIPKLVLFNARIGIYIEMSVEDFTAGVSGLSPADYCQQLVDSFSAALTSN